MMASSEARVPVLKMSYKQLVSRSEKLATSQRDRGVHLIEEAVSPSETLNLKVPEHESEKGRGPPPQQLEKEWRTNEKKLEKMIFRWAGSTDHLDQVFTICRNMEQISYQIIEGGAMKDDFISKTWRLCHYRVIEKLRKFYKQAKTSVIKTSMEADMRSFLQSSKQYYSNIAELYQKIAQLDINEIIQKGGIVYSSKNQRNQIKICVNLLHQCYLCLGDLSRYLEELQETPDWSKPRNCYLKSQELVPKDGKPYNQLAVIAINAHRRFDAVYYYCRSYWVSNSFLSAHDSLVGLFAETMKKAKEEEERKGVSLGDTGKSTANKKHSREVWIMPGKESVPVTEFDELRQLETPELFRKLINVFLLAIGKLFTKVSIGLYAVTVKEFLSTLQLCLERDSPSSRYAIKFLQMTAIVISTIHYVVENSGDPHSRAIGLGMSLSLGLDYIVCLLRHCHKALCSQDPSLLLTEGIIKTLSTILILLPSVRVWFYWISTHKSLWEPLLTSPNNKSLITSFHEFFTEFCQVLNTSQQVLPLRIAPPDSVLYCCSKFWEDKMLAGFSCLPSLAGLGFEDTVITPDFGQLNDEQLHFQCLSRLSLVQFETIGQIDTVLSDVIEYDISTNLLSVKLHVPVDGEMDTDISPVKEIENDEEPNKTQTVTTEDVISTTVEEVTDSLGILELKKEKDRLSRQLQKHQEHQETAESLLKEISRNQSEVIIKPRYLVPDTNCFVDYLKYLRQLLVTGDFVITIPLIVIAELEGLSKGNQEGTQPSRSVDHLALSAVQFIKDTISTGTPNMKAITSQGNLLSSLLLTSEEAYDGSCNDDLILSSCVKLHQRIDSNTHSVVLLTDDRNLRVKSHASHMPVRSVQQFLKLM